MNVNDFSVVERTGYFAQKLFPYASKQNARRLFTTLCKRNKALMDALAQSGWHLNEIFITRTQIRIVLHYFCD